MAIFNSYVKLPEGNSALHSPADACLASALELSDSLRAAAAATPSLAATRATVGVANAAVPVGAGQHGSMVQIAVFLKLLNYNICYYWIYYY
jgi:hypothetical protein